MIDPKSASIGFAYIDPFSGSLLLQVILAGVAGVGVLLKILGRRLFLSVTPWRKQDKPPPDFDADRPSRQAPTSNSNGSGAAAN